MTSPVDWPRVEYAISFSSGPTDAPLADYWLDVTTRTEGQFTVTRGKQYELDQVQPAEAMFTLRNDDGLFDSSNTSSVLFPQIKPNRLTRVRSQYPSTRNMLVADQATAWFASYGNVGYPTALPANVVAGPAVSSLVPGGLAIGASGTTNGYRATTTAQASPFPDQMLAGFTGFAVTPGVAYSGQAWVKGAVAFAGNLRVQIDWFDATGTLISSSNGSASLIGTSLVELTASGTAPANAAGGRLAVVYVADINRPSAIITISNLQLEPAATPGSWITPGTWYWLYTGYIERWPQTWSSAGNYGTVALTAVDLFSFLANVNLKAAAYLELLALGPTWFYPLDDAGGATMFHDESPNNAAAATLLASLVGDRAGVSGVELAAAGSGWQPLGITGPVATLSDTTALQSKGIQLFNGGPPATGDFTRILAVKVGTGLPAAWRALWIAENLALPTVSRYWLFEETDGSIRVMVTNANGSYTSPDLFSETINDGGWHLIGFSVSANGTNLQIWHDDHSQGVLAPGFDVRFNSAAGTDRIGPAGRKTPSVATSQVNCDVAFLAELPFTPTPTQWRNLYKAFRSGWGTDTAVGVSESSGSRYSRILGWLDAIGASTLQATSVIDAGNSTSYGPAVDLPGAAALSALQAVVDSEVGQHFISANGTPRFQARGERFNQSPIATFGEQAGEIAYGDMSIDLDPTLVLNYVTTNTPDGANTASSTATAFDITSRDDYGLMTGDRTANTTDAGELEDIAEALIYQHKQPAPRIAAITVDVGANPALWPNLLALEIGAPVRVHRRPSNAPAITIDGFVEQIAWSIDDQRHVTWTAQVSNATLHQFGAFNDPTYGAFGSTLIFGF